MGKVISTEPGQCEREHHCHHHHLRYCRYFQMCPCLSHSQLSANPILSQLILIVDLEIFPLAPVYVLFADFLQMLPS